jgi:hypothetical protein
MKNAHPETTKVSALDKPHFNLTSTSACRCWRGNCRMSLVCSTCRRWFNLAERFQVGGALHGN